VGDPEGSIRDPAVHYDGQRIVFSWRKSGTEHFHLYEIRADGTGLHQLTDGGGDYDDIEPTYLPDGGIAFVSSRCRRWVNCWLTQVGVIYRCEADGSDIQRLSANIEHDNTPWPLPDGRLIYQRWEYIDRSQVHYHHLWTMNPDGTGQMVYFGNMHGGGVFIDAKPVPGSDEVVLILSPGHGQREHTGSVALLTPKRGPDCQPSMRRLTDGGFRDPYAIEAGWFLAAKGRAMYLVGRERQLIEFFSLPDGLSPGSLQEPRPLVAHQRERLIPPRTDARKPTGELVLHDIYQGRNMTGVERGEIKQLLVLEALPKPINFTGGMEPLSYGGTFTLERIVGTVPVETDGSAHLSLPANRALFLVALDSQGRSVKRMQSFLTVRPGETTSCVGCHEARTQAPANLTGRAGRSLASRRAPSTPIHVPGVPEVLDYPRDVQPVLDRHCVRCHKPDRRSGGVLLTGDRGPLYSHSYFMLSARQQIADGRNLARSNYPPRALGDSGSALMDKLASGRHHGVQAPEADLRIVRYWLNSGAAYPGTYAALGTGMVGGYAQNQIDRQDLDWPEMKAAMGVLDRRCMSCHADAHRPLPQSPSDNGGMPPWAIHYASPRLKLSRHIVYNLSRPEKSVLLLAPLARKAGGYAMQKRDKEGMPVGDPIEVFATNEDPDFQTLLRSIQRTKQRLDTIGRFDMPGFAPSPAYLREMRRYGLLGKDETPVGAQIYELERRYWESFAYHPTP
jgi:mono/diheme cytochrome c family protein